MNIRRALATGLLAAGALIVPLAGTGQTHAAISTCRTDPLFEFSNSLGQSHKDQISFSLPSSTTVYNSVTNVHYDVHVPSNTTTYTVSDPTNDPYYGKSTWTVTKDMPAGEYEVFGYVSTTAPNIAISLTQQVVLNATKNGGSSVKTTVNGTTNQYYLTIDQKNVQ